MAEAGSGAAQVLDDLYRQHAGEVYRYAFAVLGGHADAEDVTQTTFVNALAALERGERPRKPSNWLITIAHNIVRQRFRAEKARPEEVALERDIAVKESADGDGPTIGDLVRGLQQIPPTQREALVMRELEGRTYKEIGEILGVTAAALESLLFRARRSLAEEMEQLVSCERAEIGMSRQLDMRITRKERRRLDQHLRDCPSCARIARAQSKHKQAFKGLALLPIPLSLTSFKGPPRAAAADMPTVSVTSASVGGSSTVGGPAVGGLALGGIVAKATALVAAMSVATAAGYASVKQLHGGESEASAVAPTHSGQFRAAARSDAPTGQAGRATTPDRSTSVERYGAQGSDESSSPTEPTVQDAGAKYKREPSHSRRVSVTATIRPKQTKTEAPKPKRIHTVRPTSATTNHGRSDGHIAKPVAPATRRGDEPPPAPESVTAAATGDVSGGTTNEVYGTNATDPLNADTKNQAFLDGSEDTNHSGVVDGDGLSDGEVAAGTDPLNPDTDGDGIPDRQDPQFLTNAVNASSPSSWHSGGNRNAFLSRLSAIETLIAHDDSAQAVNELQLLRQKIDGCGGSPDINDWIIDCTLQVAIRGYVDLLITNLS